jgi:hydroxyacylglutathione hydrolase
MDIEIFEVGPFAENTYLLCDEGDGILVDPGFFDPREYNAFRQKMDYKSIQLQAVLLTHAHVDHVLGLERVLKDFSVPVYLNHTDLFLWENFPDQAAMFGVRTSGFDFIPEPLPEMQNHLIGNFTFDVLYTPGHSPDHISIYFKKYDILVAGDVLFSESIGRTDLYKGDFNELANSIRLKLYTLPDDTSVYPGHGPKTTIGHEKRNNAFVRAED